MSNSKKTPSDKHKVVGPAKQVTAPISSTEPGSFSIRKLQLFVVFAFAFLLYANTLSNGYALDDAIVINNNQFTKQGLHGIKDILTKDTFYGFFGQKKDLVSGGRYRPLSLVTFAIEYAFFGESPAVSHFGNLLLYGLTGVLLLLLLYKLFPAEEDDKDSWYSLPFIATLLFIAHPLHTEAVANIKGRDEIMCFMGCIAAVYCVFKYRESNKVIWLISGAFIFFLALMSKENAITFLAIIPITIFFFSKSDVKKTIYCTLPFIGITAFYWLLRITFAGSSSNVEITEVLNNPFVFMNAAEKYATIMFTLGKYLLLLVFPHPLTHDYYYNQIQKMEWSNVKVLLSLALYVALGIYALLNIRKKSVIAYAIIFYLATLSIVSNIFFPIGTFMNERFLYFSSLGFCLVLAYFLIKWLAPKTGKELNPKTLTLVAGCILLLYSFKTVTRNEAWKDNMTLFTTDIKTSPNSVKLLNSVGGQTMEASDKETDPVKKREMLQQAITYLKKAVDIYPNYNIAWLLLGNAYFRFDNDYKDAVTCYQNALRINPDYVDAYTNLALAYRQLNNYTEAITVNKKLLNYKSQDPLIYTSIAELYKLANQPDSGIVYYNKVLALDANNANAYREIGTLYGQFKNDIDNALKYLLRAVELNPKDATAYENLGICYGFKKNFDAAIDAFSKSLELNPANLNLYKNIGVSYQQKGNVQKAQEYFAKAQGK